MAIAYHFHSFLISFWTIPIYLFNILLTPPLPSHTMSTTTTTFSPPSPSLDPEGVTTLQKQQPPVIIHHCDQQNLEWTKLILCFSSAVEMAIQSTQSNLLQCPLFSMLSLVVSLAFAALFVAKSIHSKFHYAAHVFERAGIFFAATTFFLAVSTPFPLYVKCTSWALYGASLLVIFVCHHMC